MPLRRWLWRSYLYSAIIPLLVIELTFLAIYWASNALVYRDNVAAVDTLSRQFLTDAAQREATAVAKSLAGISGSTGLLASQTLRALNGNHQPSAAERARYAMSPGGALYTRYDNGGTASFYSGISPIGAAEMAKVWKLGAIDPLMIDIKRGDPAVASVYFNSFDSYNRIYPWFDVLAQYPPRMNIPAYNFYYLADAAHNPQRKAVWTDAYIDPAGQGWMVSSIAPVWNGGRLEGVVGIDVTLQTIVQRLLALKLPWHGYAILVDRQGRIIALPPEGEADFGLKELTAHRYSEAILSDRFKPDSFNIFKRKDTAALAAAMRKAPSGEATLQFDGPHQASFATVVGPEWRLVVIAPASEIQGNATMLRDRLQAVALTMIAALLVFYALFFAFLYRRAQAMSARVAAPLDAISQLIARIGKGDYRHGFAGSEITELAEVGEQLARTGEQLGEAHERISEQERLVTRALLRQRQANEEQVRFVRMISHELRTPLSVIDSGAQIIDRKAGTMPVADLRLRTAKLRKAVRRISDLLHKLVASSGIENSGETGLLGAQLHPLVIDTAMAMIPPERIELDAMDIDAVVADGATVAIALRGVIDNALLYSPEQSPVAVSLVANEHQAVIAVTNRGPVIPKAELAQVGERYFRGSAAFGKEGAGISIHVALKLLERIGGSLELRSDENGTVATIHVPVTCPVTCEIAVAEPIAVPQ